MYPLTSVYFPHLPEPLASILLFSASPHPYLHILTITYLLSFLILAILPGVRWYSIVAFIYISQWLVILSTFSCICCMHLLLRNVYSGHLPIIQSCLCCLPIWLFEFLIHFIGYPMSDVWLVNILSHLEVISSLCWCFLFSAEVFRMTQSHLSVLLLTVLWEYI